MTTPRAWTCEGCDARFEAPDRAGIVDASHAHLSDAHPEWGISRRNAEEYWDAVDRITGSTERLDAIGRVTTAPAAEDVEGVLAFFDRDAFAGNPAWGACYCMFHHLRFEADRWAERGAADNRPELERRLRDGRTIGWVARVDGRIAGWVNASPLAAYPDHGLGDLAPEDVGAIVCFVIAPPYRGHGLARRLLEAALDGFRDQGLSWAEAYPRPEATTAAANYTGPLALYVEAGFEQVGEREGSPVVRRRLR
jgi:GNAT superfamily N-acetyltransferase